MSLLSDHCIDTINQQMGGGWSHCSIEGLRCQSQTQSDSYFTRYSVRPAGLEGCPCCGRDEDPKYHKDPQEIIHRSGWEDSSPFIRPGRETFGTLSPNIGNCHDRDNSRLAPSENARKANTGRRERVQSPPTEPQRASKQREHARYLSYFSLSPLSPCTYYI